jgi:hypothetical protein
VLQLEPQVLGFEFRGQPRRVKIGSLLQADFFHSAPAADGDAGPSGADPAAIGLAVQLPGIAIRLQSVRLRGNRLLATTTWGQQLSLPRTGAELRVVNGRVVQLTSIEPAAVRHTPYLGTPFPWQSQSPTGWTIRGRTFSDGILMHSKTELTYALDGRYERLRAVLGMQQPEGQLGQAIVQVLLDGKPAVKWDISGGDGPRIVDLLLNGARQMTLSVDYGAGQDVGDRVVWGAPRLTRTAK